MQNLVAVSHKACRRSQKF